MMPRLRTASMAVLVALGAVVALGPGTASAATTTTVAFSEQQVSAPFASNWTAQIQVSGVGMLVTEGDGQVDISIDGIPGVWASLDLMVGGYAFLSQPLDQPLLPAGDYSVRALLIPSGSGLSPATSAPLALTITPLTTTATVSTELTGETLTVTGELSGTYLESTGLAPAGIWQAALSTSADETAIETLRFAQDATERDPVSATFATTLSLGTEYRVDWSFTPVDELAAGLDLTATGTETVETRAPTIIDAVTAPIAWPLWASIAAGATIVLLAGAVIAFAVLARRKRSKSETIAVNDDDPAMIES